MARRRLDRVVAGVALTWAVVLTVFLAVPALSQPTFSAVTALLAYKTAVGVVSEVTVANPLPVTGTVTTSATQATTGAVLADLAVTVASQVVVASSATRMGLTCWNQGTAPNGIRIGFGATPTSTTGFYLAPGMGFTDPGTYAVNAIRDTGATGNPTLSCSSVSQ